MFQQDRIRILIGVSIVGFAAPLWWVFAGAIATHMRRIEGTHYPLTRIQVACAGGTAVIILLEVWLVLAICFRPNIEPSAVQLANDFIWLTFVGFYPPGVLQNVVIGTCILTDKSETPIFPRWVGFANFWMALGFMPGIYIVFFKSGPFAWDGILGFWIIALCFFAWIGMMWWSVVRAVKQA
ncbi:MAG: hypothetical protein OXC05_00955 [Halieaceae bacterium]|nr:hypothetical protein [Halieaceae bacterium]